MSKLAKILLVEDKSIVAQELKANLESLGYEVLGSANYEELAIQKNAEIMPNLVLIDVRLMGEVNGISTAESITKWNNFFSYILQLFQEKKLHSALEIGLDKHQLEKQLGENEQWLTTVLRSIGDGVITTDNQGSITYLNPVAEKLTGWLSQEAVGRNLGEVFKIIDENSRKICTIPIVEILKNWQNLSLPKQILLVRKDGSEIAIEDSISPIVNNKSIAGNKNTRDKTSGAVLVFRDTTEQREVVQKLRRQAFYDSLTNLPNRAWFLERLTDAVERVKRYPNYLFAVLFLDLDRFKIINDSLGHLFGDRLLVAVARRLSNSVRPNDTVGRLGGDEFAIILEGLQNLTEAHKIAERIQQELSITFNIEGQELYTSASIGIVFSSTNYLGVEELIRNADIAMYRAKGKGKGCCEVFDPDMHNQIVAISQLEKELRKAIERNELVVHYQPIVCLTTQKTIGFEALVRWNHPQQGLVSPQKFIPLAEEIGLIFQIDCWVLRAACRQMQLWREQEQIAAEVTISVNVSSKQFGQSHFVEEIKKILDETHLEYSNLNLEITENALVENTESAAALLRELKALGISLSLDDFGTGYSSLSYLHRFPVDIIKIDRSFINRINFDGGSLEIVRSILLLGQNLGLKVVAEGVETAEQVSLLQNLQCPYGQGHFFAQSPTYDNSRLSEVQIDRVKE